MTKLDSYTIDHEASLKDAMAQLNLAETTTLFVIDGIGRLLGTLTDGDIRRALLKDVHLDESVIQVAHRDFRKLTPQTDVSAIRSYREQGLREMPVLDDAGKLCRVVDLQKLKSALPIQAVIMAGGKGTRLLPLTQDIPKPLIEVGGKPIIQYNLERLRDYGVHQVDISVKHLAHKIEERFGDGTELGLEVGYIHEDEPRGTLGAISELKKINQETILVMNSDLLTNVDYEDMYLRFRESGAHMLVCTIPYEVRIPYGVIETEGNHVTALQEKPTYTYYSNAGIYLISKSLLDYVPKVGKFNATDLIETLIEEGLSVYNYPISSYWLDIGKHHDLEKARQDVHQIKF